jgi:hypothetical protein
MMLDHEGSACGS